MKTLITMVTAFGWIHLVRPGGHIVVGLLHPLTLITGSGSPEKLTIENKKFFSPCLISDNHSTKRK